MQPIAKMLLGDKDFKVVELGFLERASLHSRLQRLSCGLDCNQSQLRNIMVLELWLRNHVPFATADGRQTHFQTSLPYKKQKKGGE
jgi:hypothetical protein